MLEINKHEFINPRYVKSIKAEEPTIVTPDKEAGTWILNVVMHGGDVHTTSGPKIEVVKKANVLMSIINTINNPMGGLTMGGPAPEPEPPADMPTHVPSDGKGAGQHKVDPNVYPPEQKDEYGYPIPGTKDWPVGHPQHPDTIAKAEEEKRIEAEVQKRLAVQNVKASEQVVVPPQGTPPVTSVPSPVPVTPPVIEQVQPPKAPPAPPKEKTGLMDVPPELQEIAPAPEPTEGREGSAFGGANDASPFG